MANHWQDLIDAGCSEQDIEQRLVAGISLDEQFDEHCRGTIDEDFIIPTNEELNAKFSAEFGSAGAF